jgi:hypothetical protein
VVMKPSRSKVFEINSIAVERSPNFGRSLIND